MLVGLILGDFPRLKFWPWHDHQSISKVARVEEHAALLVSLKEDSSRIYREASTRSCLAMVCLCPAACYCLLGLSLSGLQICTSSGTFSASSSKAGITTSVIRQVWVMSFPSANFLSQWVLEICLFWAKLLNGDVTVTPKGSEEWRESLGCVHSAHLLPLLFTGGWRKLFHSVQDLQWNADYWKGVCLGC